MCLYYVICIHNHNIYICVCVFVCVCCWVHPKFATNLLMTSYDELLCLFFKAIYAGEISFFGGGQIPMVQR